MRPPLIRSRARKECRVSQLSPPPLQAHPRLHNITAYTAESCPQLPSVPTKQYVQCQWNIQTLTARGALAQPARTTAGTRFLSSVSCQFSKAKPEPSFSSKWFELFAEQGWKSVTNHLLRFGRGLYLLPTLRATGEEACGSRTGKSFMLVPSCS